MVLKHLCRNGHGELRHLAQVQRDNAHHLPLEIEQWSAAKARIERGCLDAAIEHIFPVGIKVAQVGHTPSSHPALLL